MANSFKDVLRRTKPAKHRTRLVHRPTGQLEFAGSAWNKHSKLLYDTTVYIDILQRRFPFDAELALRSAEAWHSTVTEAELAALCGLLDPAHPGTSTVVEQVSAVIERRPGHRTLAPDREIWQEAGVLAGLLARLQQYAKAERRRILNDALLFSTARKHGLTVLTRNVQDFDLLQQIEPSGRVLFYSV
jgi:predicted nucleic acid-binding protein